MRHLAQRLPQLQAATQGKALCSQAHLRSRLAHICSSSGIIRLTAMRAASPSFPEQQQGLVEQRHVQGRHPTWQASIQHRTNGTGYPHNVGQAACPCNALAHKHLEVAAEWDRETNGERTPETVAGGSATDAAWRCGLSWHRCSANVFSRALLGTGCPQCGREAGLHAQGCCLCARFKEARLFKREALGLSGMHNTALCQGIHAVRCRPPVVLL